MFRLVSWFGLAGSALAFTASPWRDAALLAYRHTDPFEISEYALSRIDRGEFEEHARVAIDEGDLEDAKIIADLAAQNGEVLPASITNEITRLEQTAYITNAKSFADGLVTGRVYNIYAMGGSVSSDFLVIGDLRDLGIEGFNLASGREYSAVILAISLLGVATTAANFVPGGTAVDVGVSAFKTASKASKAAGTIPSGLLKHVGDAAKNSVDTKAVRELFTVSNARQIWSSVSFPSYETVMTRFRKSPANLRSSEIRQGIAPIKSEIGGSLVKKVTGVFRQGEIAKLQRMTDDISRVGSNASMKAAVKSINLSDNFADAAKLAKLSERAKTTMAARLRILGKSAFKLGNMLFDVIAALMAALAWLLWATWMISKPIRLASALVFKKMPKLATPA
ncbi:hypothetical protein [Aliihoeflea sp.]|uniref:hypothetical protein n=1 Tax=Aliihoeflea sp. TaxID=2608088 RepID=UPI00403352FD